MARHGRGLMRPLLRPRPLFGLGKATYFLGGLATAYAANKIMENADEKKD